MNETEIIDEHEDPFDLERFISAQADVYTTALAELRSGQKHTHWMWYIFPQIAGLGFSATSQHFAIQNLKEAQSYIAHPVLGPRLRECAETVLYIEGRNVSQIFGSPDDIKFKSSMTLFAYAAGDNALFIRLLKKYFNGEQDAETMHKLEQDTGKSESISYGYID